MAKNDFLLGILVLIVFFLVLLWFLGAFRPSTPKERVIYKETPVVYDYPVYLYNRRYDYDYPSYPIWNIFTGYPKWGGGGLPGMKPPHPPPHPPPAPPVPAPAPAPAAPPPAPAPAPAPAPSP